MTTHNGKLFIETVGCQMNMLDSELVVAALRKQGYELTPDVAAADTILKKCLPPTKRPSNAKESPPSSSPKRSKATAWAKAARAAT